MAITTYELKISERVPLGTERFQSIIPPSGSTVQVTIFCGEGAYTVNSEVLLVWDYDTASEEILWSIKGSGRMPCSILIPCSSTNGVRKLALVCDNGELGALIMSAYCKIEVDSL